MKTPAPMKTQVTFDSDAFPPVPGDTINAPHIYGKKLAQWLAAELPAHGLAVRDCHDEDWGWEIAFENAAFPLRLGCSSMEDEGFLCFITPDRPIVRPLKRLFCATRRSGYQIPSYIVRPLKRLFRATETRPAVEKLAAALDAVLRSHPRVHNIEWQKAE